jgi:hypothetical protein
MDFIYFIVGSFVLIVVIVIIFAINDNIDKKNTLNEFATLGYNFENKLEVNNHTFAIDKTKETLLIIKPHSTTQINQPRKCLLNFKDIIGFEVSKNGETITKASLGAPIVGGLVFGVGGAIVGSILGNRKSKEQLKINIVLQLNSFDNPIIKIPILAGCEAEIVKKSYLEQIDKLCVWFKLILDENERKKVSNNL